jgi:hypothetical protein
LEAPAATATLSAINMERHYKSENHALEVESDSALPDLFFLIIKRLSLAIEVLSLTNGHAAPASMNLVSTENRSAFSGRSN